MNDFATIKRMAQAMIGDETRHIPTEELQSVVARIATLYPNFRDHEQLVAELQARYSVTVAEGNILSEDSGHIQWLGKRRPELDWEFWKRYRIWLTDSKGFSPAVVNQLDRLTDQVLEQIENPNRTGHWDRRGLVVGQVQSGKTSHYTGLICKAVDAGYKLIIVLAGVHNSLRSQTQLRLDEGFLGKDTQLERAWLKNTKFIGVGKIADTKLRVAYATTSEETGDFSKNFAKQYGFPLGGSPLLLVVKKNSSVLKNLLKWLESLASVQDTDGNTYLADIPLLLLDDEADHASVNTREVLVDETGKPLSNQEMTAINGRIRELLRLSTQSAYVGYTATPFANVFIHPQVKTDLFPRHFILNLPAPSNYIGPVQVFGLGEDGDSFLEQNGLPTTRYLDDFHDDLPQGHRIDQAVVRLPPSLREAILSFVITCAVRIARGQGTQHNSMLVHVTRFVRVQQQVAELVEAEVQALRNRIVYGDGDRSDRLIDELEVLFRRDFEPTTQAVKVLIDDPEMKVQTWATVSPHLKVAVGKLTVKIINGSAKDVLDYYGTPDGINVIAIGGDKLSRGLTLEGLSISYYLRASRMYDTLMQMGRWFGYRPGYSDLCRLYTTTELVDWYRHITIASEELRREFDEMARAGRTPADFGLKVLAHPGGLTVSGAGKLRNHTQMRVSFSDRLIESYRISSIRSDQQSNFLALSSLIGSLGKKMSAPGHIQWSDARHQLVTAFLRELSGYPKAFDFAPDRLAEFIDKLVSVGELTNWNIGLINIAENVTKGKFADIAGHRVGYSLRTPEEGEKDQIQIRRRHIISMDHEWIDIRKEEDKIRALRYWEDEQTDLTKTPPTTLPGRFARKVRPESHGLLLLYLLDPTAEGLPPDQQDVPYLGYALSFPSSEQGKNMAVSYVVNSVYAEEEFEAD